MEQHGQASCQLCINASMSNVVTVLLALHDTTGMLLFQDADDLIWQSDVWLAENSAAFTGCPSELNNCLQRQERIWQQNSRPGSGARLPHPCSPSGMHWVLQLHQLQGPCVPATLLASPGSRRTCCALPSPFQQMLCHPGWALFSVLKLGTIPTTSPPASSANLAELHWLRAQAFSARSS